MLSFARTWMKYVEKWIILINHSFQAIDAQQKRCFQEELLEKQLKAKQATLQVLKCENAKMLNDAKQVVWIPIFLEEAHGEIFLEKSPFQKYRRCESTQMVWTILICYDCDAQDLMQREHGAEGEAKRYLLNEKLVIGTDS